MHNGARASWAFYCYLNFNEHVLARFEIHTIKNVIFFLSFYVFHFCKRTSFYYYINKFDSFSWEMLTIIHAVQKFEFKIYPDFDPSYSHGTGKRS